MKDSAIEWTDHTFNPWTGCSKVSPGCDKCYAESWAKRTGHPELWAGERRRTTAANWRQPEKWNREAAAAGVRKRVFCASLADVFDNQVPEQWRHDLWSLIARTPNLDWLLLTKRPQNIAKMLPTMDSRSPGYQPWNHLWPWPHVWLGTTAENQEEADRRIPLLLEAPAAVRFLSCEPLLAAVDIARWLRPRSRPNKDGYGGDHAPGWTTDRRTIDWVIVGGESGPGSRPCDVQWIRSIVEQCKSAGTACFVKQLGARPMGDGDDLPLKRISYRDDAHEERFPLRLRDRKGGDPEEWPSDLRVREFPRAPA